MKILHRILILSVCLVFAHSKNAYALAVYGETNGSAAVAYDGSASSAEYSVVRAGSASAVYLGNGWFITAAHVGISTSSTITQNGVSAGVSYVDNTLKSSYGADLALFYVEDLSSFDYLESVSIAPRSVFDGLADTLSTISAASQPPHDVSYTEGTSLLLAGAGFGRSSESGIYDVDVNADGVRGTVRSGSASVAQIGTDSGSGASLIVTMAQSKDGYSQALDGDSGGGMFASSNGEHYLLAIMVGVQNAGAANEAHFGDYDNITFDGSTWNTDVLDSSSYTFGISLADYADYINSMIATDPLAVPEPAACALFFGLAAAALVYKSRKR